MSDAAELIIDTRHLSRAQEVDVVRQVLATVSSRASSLETDIPWTESAGWPRHVEDAARLLAGSEGSDGMYQRVGERPVSRESWSAFVTFAPYAYGCLVRTSDGDLVASVDDEGTSMWVRLTADQRDQLERTVGAAQIVPIADWNARRKDFWCSRWRRAVRR